MNAEIIFFSLAIIFGLYMSWNIGANDVSNALGTSVGSKALTIKKAIIIAICLEFAGAFFLGANVSSTIQQDVVDPNIFSADPNIFAIGMLSALLTTGILLNLASFFHLPISTTHAIIGAIIGFGLASKGVNSIEWKHISFITLSWIITPILSAILSLYIFKAIQRKILFSKKPIKATKKFVPYIVFLAIFYFSFTLLNHNNHLTLKIEYSIILSLCIGLFASLFSKLMLKKIKESTYSNINSEIKKRLLFKSTHDKYDLIEKIFAYLQIISASMIAFAHGANDIANAIGPAAAVIEVLKINAIPKNFTIPTYVLFLGAIGIVIGLSTWGWRVIATIGKKITTLTPTRGFAAEIGAALTIIFASKLGMPVSTTHAIVGAVLGIGIVRGISSINLKIIKNILLSWFITIPLSAILSIIIFFILKTVI